jgi:hypothetical protein
MSKPGTPDNPLARSRGVRVFSAISTICFYSLLGGPNIRPYQGLKITEEDLTKPVRRSIYLIDMPFLIVGDKQVAVPGLGKNRSLADLSQKRVTKATREALRSEYGHENVTCSCRATFASGKWIGQCYIHGQIHIFRIEE